MTYIKTIDIIEIFLLKFFIIKIWLIFTRYIITDIQVQPISASRTSVSTFEKNFGDWMKVSSGSLKWNRGTFLSDHTQVDTSKKILYRYSHTPCIL